MISTEPSVMIEQLIASGLVQFGLFGDGSPVRFHLERLSAYPRVLSSFTEALVALQDTSVTDKHRVLVPHDSIVLGVAFSLATGIPLVYSRGQYHSVRDDLVGAYDMGHPTYLIVGALTPSRKFSGYLSDVRRVGLEVAQVYIGIKAVNDDLLPVHVECRSYIDLPKELSGIVEKGWLPVPMGQRVQTWMSDET